MHARSTLFAAFVLGACSHHSTTEASPNRPRLASPDSVFVEGRTFRDGRGRQLLFRGYNAKVNGLFDVSFDDGRTPNYTFPSLDEAGAQRMEELGFDVIRLCINWSALEPKPKQYSADFFATLDAILALAKKHHLYVLLDMHQDAYSKEIGEDGAPLWAIVPPPEKILQGPSDDSRRLSNQVLKAGFSFFDDAPLDDGRTLQQAFIDAVSEMVKRHLGDPTVLGVEDFNEPVVLLDEKLQTFHQRFADAMHAIDPDLPLFFEPIATRNPSVAPSTIRKAARSWSRTSCARSFKSAGSSASASPSRTGVSTSYTPATFATWKTPARRPTSSSSASIATRAFARSRGQVGR